MSEAKVEVGGDKRSDLSMIRKRSVLIAKHRTSISMEEIFWVQLKNIAENRQMSLNALVTEIDASRTGNLSSAIRVFVFEQKLPK